MRVPIITRSIGSGWQQLTYPAYRTISVTSYTSNMKRIWYLTYSIIWYQLLRYMKKEVKYNLRNLSKMPFSKEGRLFQPQQFEQQQLILDPTHTFTIFYLVALNTSRHLQCLQSNKGLQCLQTDKQTNSTIAH